MKAKAKRLVILIVIVSLGLAACAVSPATPAPVPATPSPVLPIPTPVPPTPTLVPPMPTPVPPTPMPKMPKGSDAVWNLVVIGDSSLGRLGRAFAAQIEKDVGVKAVLEDVVVIDLSAGTVLRALQPGDTWIREFPETLRGAEVVVMFVSPPSSVDPEKTLNFAGCFHYRAPKSCSPKSFEKYTANMKANWARILELRAGQLSILRATDIYNPLVSPWHEGGVFEACTVCWENTSDAARLAAEAYDIPFLSRYDAFNGAKHNEDPREKGYIREQLGNGPHKFVWYNRSHDELERLTKGKRVGEARAKGKWLFISLEPGYVLLLGECGAVGR